MTHAPKLPESNPERNAEADLLRRRQFTYSENALKAGQQVYTTYVPHPAVENVLSALDRSVQLAESLSMVQGIRIVGPTGSGKTSVVRYFQDSLRPCGSTEESTRTLYVRLQEQPSVARMISTLLQACRYPFSQVSNRNVGIKRDLLIEALQHRGTALLIVDEAHYLCQQRRGRSPDRIGTFATDFLRELADEVPLVLALVGETTLHRLEELDSHLAARVPVVFALDNFTASDKHWLSTVMTLFSACPDVRFSPLTNHAEMQRIHSATAGNMRQLKWLLSEAVMVACDSHQDEVRSQNMQIAFDRIKGNSSGLSNPWKA